MIPSATAFRLVRSIKHEPEGVITEPAGAEGVVCAAGRVIIAVVTHERPTGPGRMLEVGESAWQRVHTSFPTVYSALSAEGLSRGLRPG